MPGLETGTIVALSVSGGLTIASTALSYFTRVQPRSEENINELDKNITDPNEYINLIYGKARVGVNRVFVETWPDNIDYLIGIGSICHGEIEDIEKVWIDNDDIIAKDNASGNLEVVKTYDGHAYFGVKLGTDTQTVFNFVRKKFKSWKKNHRGRGIASIAMQLRYDQDLYTTGIPNITILVKGKKVRDPRDLADPPTATQADWDALTPAWSNNPSLCALDYLMSSRYGIGSPATRVDFQSFCDIANYCDTIVNSGSYIEAPSPCKAELIKSKINLTNGTTYYYKYSFVKETSADAYQVSFESALSPVSSAMTISTRKGRVRLSGILASSDSTITHRNIYRSTSATGTFYYVGMLDNNTSTTFIDNMSDADATLGGTHTPTGSGTNPTSACTATFTDLRGSLEANKLYRYKVTFVNTAGQETEAGDASNRIKTDSEYKAIYLSKIPISEDENVKWRRIYRTTGYLATESIPDYKLVYTIENNTTRAWEDTLADASLGAVAPSTPTAYTGSFKMYTCNGVIDTSKEVDENIEEILSSCRGKIFYSGGKYKVSIRRVVTPETIKLTEDNIIGDWEWSAPGFKEMCNVISTEWRNPQENWQYEPFIWPKAGESNQYLIDDNNFENIREIRLPFTTVKKQAKLIAQIIRKESRQQIRCQVTIKEEGLNFEYDSLVYITHPLPGWTDKLFWVDEVGILQNGNVRLALTEYDSSSYDLDTINKDTSDGDDTTLPDPRQPPPEVSSVTLAEESFLDGSVPNWRIKVVYTDPVGTFWDYSNVYVKSGTDSEYELYTKINKLSNGIFYIQPIEPLNKYYVKICSVSVLGSQTDIDDATEYTLTINAPTPDEVSDLEIENRGSDDNVYGNSFKFRWSDKSSFASDGRSKNSYAHQQVSVLNENIKYLVEIYPSAIPSTVRISGLIANQRTLRTVLQKHNKFEYTVDNAIEDSKKMFSAYENQKTHTYYKNYYGIPQREIKIVVSTLNGWSVLSSITVTKIVTNKAPDMLKRDGVTLIKPDVEIILNGAEIKFSHPPDEYDINYFMLLVAGDTTGGRSASQVAQAFGATRHKTETTYVAGANGNVIYPPDLNGHCYKCTTAGTTGSTAPTFTKPSIGTLHPTVTDGTVVWTHWCILRQKKISAQITVDSTENEIDSASYEVEIKKLDRKKTYYAAVIPYDAYGVGTISNISDDFVPGESEDDSKTQIIEPIGGSDIAVTFDLEGRSNGKVKWTKDSADDRDQTILQWRGVEDTSAIIQPTQTEASNGVTAGGKAVISGREIVDFDANTGNNFNWYTLKDLKNGYKYFARVRYVNKAQHKGDWSHTDDGLETWATHSGTIQGVSADDLDWEFKKYIYEGSFSATDYNTVAWAKGSDTGKIKFKKADGTTTNYTITDGNTGNLTLPSYIVHPGDAPNPNTKFKVISVSDFWAGATSGYTPVAYVKPATDTQEKAFYSRFSDKKDFAINSSFISALSIITGMLQAGAVTAEKISVTNLSAISAILGALTMTDTSGSSITMKDNADVKRIFLSTQSGSKPVLRISKTGFDASTALSSEECLFTTEDDSGNILDNYKLLERGSHTATTFTDPGNIGAYSSIYQYSWIATTQNTQKIIRGNMYIPGAAKLTTPLNWWEILRFDSDGIVFMQVNIHHQPGNVESKRIYLERIFINASAAAYNPGSNDWSDRKFIWELFSETIS